MSIVPRRVAALLATLFLAAGLGVTLSAPAAHAATGSIIAPCNALQDGQYRWYGRTLTECTFIPGLGFYWVKVQNSCGGVAPGSKPAASHC